MMKAILSLFTLIILANSCSTKKELPTLANQELEIYTEKSTVGKALNFEKSLNSEYEILIKSVGLSNSVYPEFDKYEISQPLIVKRSNNGFLPVYAEYFFSIPDSTLRYISYDWEIDRYGNYNNKPKIWKEESVKIDEYNKQYEKLKDELINKFGEPTEQDNKPEITKSKYSGNDYLSRNTVWEDNNLFAKLNLVFASNTYRIRLNYYWKN